MFFIKDIRKFLISVFVAGSVAFSGSCLVASTGLARFATDWEPVSRGLGAIAAPGSAEKVSLAKFRDSKLILDTAITFIVSNMSADASLVTGMVRRRFNWESSVLQPLRNALARLKLLKESTDLAISSAHEERGSVLVNPALQYMMAQSKKMQRVASRMRTVNRALKSFNASSKFKGLAKSVVSQSHSDSCEEVVSAGVKHELEHVDGGSSSEHYQAGCDVDDEEAVELEFDLDSCEDSFGGSSMSSSSGSHAPVDIDVEFIATNDALAALEANILSQLTGGVRTVIVTQTKMIGAPPKRPIMSVEDALARLAELRPELDAIMESLSGAIAGMCREFSKRMPALITERAYLQSVLDLGDAVEEARMLLAIDTARV